ncbi:MAG: hypothetical protein GYA46_13935 [candidate division Zixibacteria bacterium]|nr:hypothetical protein [candidate division Zixibacteria bacterium]
MAMLFTYESYRRLLETIGRSGYAIYGIEDILAARAAGTIPDGTYVAIRHDVDYFPDRAKAIAEIEAERRISTTYYIRRRFFDTDIDMVRTIAGLGHQVGYHYEEVDTHQKAPNLQVGRDALGFFIGSLLDIDRLGFHIRSICAHGNPMTDVDNRQVVHLLRDPEVLDHLAFTYDRDEIRTKIIERLIGDASIDITGRDFDLYIPDTGRFNPRFNLKDRIDDCAIAGLRSLDDLDRLLQDGAHRRIYMNMHPDRWSGDPVTWLFDWSLDTVKNLLKAVLGKSGYRGNLIGTKAKKHHRAVMESLGEKTDEGQGSGS